MAIEENNQDIDDNDDDDAVQYVKLVSAEGYEFFVDRHIAISSSTTIRTMLSGSFLEGKENIIRLPDMAGYILERLVRYMHYKAQYSNSGSRIPEFVRTLIFTRKRHTLARRIEYFEPNDLTTSFLFCLSSFFIWYRLSNRKLH